MSEDFYLSLLNYRKTFYANLFHSDYLSILLLSLCAQKIKIQRRSLEVKLVFKMCILLEKFQTF